jgi:aerobic C4-dicarboxylate transport protein
MRGLVRLANIGPMACTGFVTPAVILASVPSIPIQPLAILVGIDKFMSECRPPTNVVGNGVATIVVSRW